MQHRPILFQHSLLLILVCPSGVHDDFVSTLYILQQQVKIKIMIIYAKIKYYNSRNKVPALFALVDGIAVELDDCGIVAVCSSTSSSEELEL